MPARRRHASARPAAPPPRRFPVGGWPIAAALAVIAIILYAIRFALLPFVFAAAIGFVTDPAVAAAARRFGWPRWLAAALLYVALLAAGAAGIYWIGAAALGDLLRLSADAPELVRNLLTQAVGAGGVRLFGAAYSVDDLMHALGSALHQLAAIGMLTRAGALTVGTLLGLALTFVLAPYFMISGPRLAAGAIWLIPPERRGGVIELLPKIIPVLRRYLLGIALVVAYAIAVAWIGFGPVFHLRHATLLAIVVGVLELVPLVGPLSSAALVGLVAVQQETLATAGLLVGFAILLRLSIDNLVGPLVLGGAVRLHPVVIIAAFICGGMLFGVVGLLLAVPAAVCVRIALEHFYAEPVRA